MTFGELLTKYKNGDLTEDQKLMVEQELEKIKSINEYLTEEIEELLIQDREGINELSEDDDTKDISRLERDIKKAVNRRLAKVIGTSVALVFAIILVIQYILSPIVASQYYNPTKKSAGKDNLQDISYDLRAITEVSMPGYTTDFFVETEDLGFGKYNLTFNRKDLFTNESTSINTYIKKGMFFAFLFNFFPHDYFAFSEFWNDQEGSVDYEDALYMKKYMSNTEIEHVKELPSTSYISGWVRFANDLTMEELCKIEMEYKEIDFKWIAIRTEEKQGQQLMGFITDVKDSSSFSVDKEKYPGFQMIDIMLSSGNGPFEVRMGKIYEAHFTSLLKYLVDHDKAVKALVGNNKNYDYKGALKYIEENDITTYGALLYGEADDLLELYESGNIITFNIDNVVASKYIR